MLGFRRRCSLCKDYGEFPKIRGTYFGVLIIGILLCGVYSRVPYFGKLPCTDGRIQVHSQRRSGFSA